MKLAFSLPVHESNQVVIGQIRNILHFNPGSIIILHISQVFTDFNSELFREFPEVYVNRYRHPIEFGQGLMNVHCSNFRFIKKLDFDVFCLMSSNEMFVRPGLVRYVERYEAGTQAVKFSFDEDWHVFSHKRVDLHPRMIAMMEKLGSNVVHGGQAEGQFFRKNIFEEINELYCSAFSSVELESFETEEIIPQTIAAGLGCKIGRPFTLVDYTQGEDFRISSTVIRLLSDGNLFGKIVVNLPRKAPCLLVNAHLNCDDTAIFSLKRIPRHSEHPLRKYIDSLRKRPVVDFKRTDELSDDLRFPLVSSAF